MAFISIGSLGGTIAMVKDEQHGGVVPKLSAELLVNAVPDLKQFAHIQAETLLQLPSPSLKIQHIMDVLHWADQQILNGADGIVLTQGTDTLEETAFLLDLFWKHDKPLIVTGAMRTPNAAGADGPANILSSVITAASPDTIGRGVLVVLNNTIHVARFIRKSHTLDVATFISSIGGSLGYVVEDRPIFFSSLKDLPKLDAQLLKKSVKIGFYECLLDGDVDVLEMMLEQNHYHGIVIAGFGAGHVSQDEMAIITRYMDKKPIILASRTYSGSTAAKTYGFCGSEIDLAAKGVILAKWLNPRQARLLLWALLASGQSIGDIKAFFNAYNP
ncbi:asparaginase [Bartonella sp. HY406]|uniref:asparaginase n=1 Tax=Bartonella sp. HY406 TaxID=2979331 RepID=UPI0021C8205D|nr:asparaginase [Bartonella sp. HY406]UXN03385.1 asparaginase [Bartonella sp. HY406]